MNYPYCACKQNKQDFVKLNIQTHICTNEYRSICYIHSIIPRREELLKTKLENIDENQFYLELSMVKERMKGIYI